MPGGQKAMLGGQKAMPGGQKAMPGGQKAGLTGQDTAPPAAKAKPGIKPNNPRQLCRSGVCQQADI